MGFYGTSRVLMSLIESLCVLINLYSSLFVLIGP